MGAWLVFRNALINQLKGAAVKAALLKILKSAALGGFRARLIAFVVEHLFDDIAEPIIKATFVNMGYLYHRVEGKILIKRVKDAKTNSDYDIAVDDIFN